MVEFLPFTLSVTSEENFFPKHFWKGEAGRLASCTRFLPPAALFCVDFVQLVSHVPLPFVRCLSLLPTQLHNTNVCHFFLPGGSTLLLSSGHPHHSWRLGLAQLVQASVIAVTEVITYVWVQTVLIFPMKYMCSSCSCGRFFCSSGN